MPKLCKCGRIVDRRCFDCYPTQHKQTTKERGYGHDWKQLSQRKRKLDPLCEECQRHGIVTPAEHVHHIVPIAEAPHLRLEWSNLMSVCTSCHDKLEPGHTRSYLRYKQG